MSKSNLNNSQNSNPNPRKKNDPRYERVIVGYRLIPMQAAHVDEIAIIEARQRGDDKYQPMHGPRCAKCFLKNPKAGHFCRWDIKNEGARDPAPKMRQVPIYRWVLRKGQAG